jgi:sugar lactone lactonase YvrE
MRGFGRSVFAGTKIETFKITVLGVLKKIDFGGDMILIRVEDGPPVKQKSGISAGMSGSPIYINGKIIGALAFAWPFAREPVAGVTPIHQMLEAYAPGSGGREAGTGSLQPIGPPLVIGGKRIARVNVVPTAAEATAVSAQTLVMAPVATPVFISGMGRPALQQLQEKFGRYGLMAMPGPGRVESAAPVKLEPGAAVGAQLVEGDVDVTAIGTVTYVKGDRVIAFGHPLFGLGSVDVPMTTAYIHGIISSQEVSFKMGSPIQAVGHISQDRNWSIGGEVGKPARMVSAQFNIRDLDRGVSRAYAIRTIRHKQMTSALLYGSLVNAVGSVAPADEGTTRSTMEITAAGLPPIRRETVFSKGPRSSGFEALFADPFAAVPMGELLELLDTLENNKFAPVPVESLKVTIEVSQERDVATVERAYIDRKRAKPGETLRIGVVIQPFNKPKELKELELTLPRNLPSGRLQIGVSGGQSTARTLSWLGIQRPPARTLPQLLTNLAERERSSDLVVEVELPVVGVSASGLEFPNMPNSVAEVLAAANPSAVRLLRGHVRKILPTRWTLSGSQILSVQVEADERDKAGPIPLPGGFPGLTGLGSLFEELYRFGGSDGPGMDGSLDDDADEAAIPGEGVQALRRAGVQAFGRAGVPVGSVRSDGSDPSALNARTPARPNAFPQGPPKAPSWEELETLAQKDVDEIGLREAVSETERSAPGRHVARLPSVWRQASEAEFGQGKTTNVLITSAGELALAPAAAKLYDSAGQFLWGQATDRQGNVYVGTWLDGKVLRIDRSGAVSTVFRSEDPAIQALCIDRSDRLYVATLPTGTISRIAPDGSARTLCRLEGASIWALACDGAGNLYAATGSGGSQPGQGAARGEETAGGTGAPISGEGKLYRIDPDGKVSLLFTAPDRHFTALVADTGDGVYAGSYPKGKVYHINAAGKITPVYEVPNAAVQSLALDGQGNLYVGCSPRATIYKVSPDGAAQLWFQGTERHAMGIVAESDGTLTVAGGAGGKLYRIAPDRTVATLFSSETTYALSLSRDAAGNLFVTTAGPSRVYRLPATGAEGGSYLSPVHDAGAAARWGVLRWSGSTEAGSVRLQTRTGSTAFPDATWSDWSEARTVSGQPITSPAGQYIQYRALLAAGTHGPTTLRSVTLFYLTKNRSPEAAINAPAAEALWSGRRAIRWSAKDPDRDPLDAGVFYQREGKNTWTRIESGPHSGTLDLSSRPSPVGKVDQIGTENKEKGLDTEKAGEKRFGAGRLPGGFHSSVFLRDLRASLGNSKRPAKSGTRARKPRGEKKPEIPRLPAADPPGVEPRDAIDDSDTVELTEEGGAQAGWNTKLVPDGRYRLKVVVSDARANPTEPLSAEKISEWILVDNTPPTVRRSAIQRDRQGLPLRIPCSDAISYLTGADYRIDGGEWIGTACEDGVWDSTSETALLDATRLPSGSHTIEFRIQDAAGNSRRETISYTRAGGRGAKG